MALGRREITKRTKALAAWRSQLDDRVGSRADIIGSMIGLKIQSSHVTEKLGITYFVREKIPKHELSPRERVPSRLRVGNRSVATDVLEWPLMAEQSLPPPLIIFDGHLQGALSCYAKSEAGHFGVSCAHCLIGPDGNPATPSSVAAYVRPSGRFVPVGQSVYLAYSPGTGLPGSFGYLDCGLFDLRDPVFAARAEAGEALPVVNDIHSLVGRALYGASPLNAPDTTDSQRTAEVVGIHAHALDELCDVVLNVEAPGTFRGDSGMLWLTEDGRAAAIHARGEVVQGPTGSRWTTAMFAKRVCHSLSVNLVLA